MWTVWTVGKWEDAMKTWNGDNVRAVERLTVGKATGACARQSALGLLPLVATRGIAQREERVGVLRIGPKQALRTRGRTKAAFETQENGNAGRRGQLTKKSGELFVAQGHHGIDTRGADARTATPMKTAQTQLNVAGSLAPTP